MHIARVRTNLKVGADTAVGQKTLIVGPNGSGKSTILNAVELALTARVSDIAGRTDIAREADVMQLAPAGQSLEALATFDDGVVAAYRVEGSTAKAKKATGDKPSDRCHDEVLPIRTLKEAVLGSAVTARKYLLSKVAGNTTRADVRDLMPEPVRPLWDKAVGAVLLATPTPDALVEVLETAGKRQRDATASAKTAREAGKLVSGGRAAPPSAAELADAAAALIDARKKRDAALAADGAFDRLKKDRADLEKLVERATKAAQALVFSKSELANLPEAKPFNPVLTHACEVMKASLADGSGECIVCNGGKVSQDDLTFIENAIAESVSVTKKQQELEKRIATEQTIADSLIEQVEALEARCEKGGESSDPLGWTVADADAELSKAETSLADLKSAAATWDTVKKAESTAVAAEKSADDWKALKEACEEAVAIVLDKAVESFVAKVQDRLPASDRFSMRLRDGEREVVQFGLVHDGTLHTALSGAEWARVITAMADACADGSKYACLIPEERAFDPETLTDVLRAFGTSSHQVLIASPVWPSKVPTGWSVVECVR